MSDKMSSLPWLEAEARARLRAVLAGKPCGLFTDVDGTISAIAPTPDAAVLLPGVAALLVEALHTFQVVAVVSGRSAQDTQHMVGVPGLLYIGNHGLERLEPISTRADQQTEQIRLLPAAVPYIPAIQAALEEVSQALAPRFPGMVVEQKGAGGSIHVRQTSDPPAAQEAVSAALKAAALQRGLRVTQGKLVVELRPPVDVDKGTAISDVIRSDGLQSALYLGDDRTDIDAFRALRQLTEQGVCRGVAIAVLHDEAPPNLAAEADLALDSIERVPVLLRWLIRAAPTEDGAEIAL